MGKILIIDDEEKLRSLLVRIIGLEGFSVIEAGDCKSGIKKINSFDPDVILCDVKLPDGNGLDLLKKIKDLNLSCEVILLTAFGNIEDSVKAIRSGAFDYITKGDDNNRIIPLLYSAFEKVKLKRKLRELENLNASPFSFEHIIGKSKSILSAIDIAKRVAETDTTVLLSGETGTGKEVFAQSIHRASKRCNQPFVAINCSAISKDLLENELFGHKAGSFTGATHDSDGIFKKANSGTIFLDEIGEMNLELQAKLLRVIESGEFIKIGDNTTTKVDIRIIAATNRILEEEINKEKFRRDLFYRISAFTIQLPPLRERVTDIESLALHFADAYSAKIGKTFLSFSPEYLEALKRHSWKGNIRELKNVIERSIILTDNGVLSPESLPFNFYQDSSDKNSTTLSAFDLASAEKLHIVKVLNYTNGNKAETARLLNIALTTLYRKIEEYHIV